MKNKLSLGLVAVACVALLASGAMGASVFFSTALRVGEGAAPTRLVWAGSGETLTLGIWASADQDYDTTIGMNVVSADPLTVALSGAHVLNPDIISEALGAPVDVRWQDVSVGDVTAGQVSNMNAASVTSGTGILGANNGSVAPFQNLDPLLDQDALGGIGAFLLGTVTMTTSTEPGFESTLSINQAGTSLFVNAGAQVFPDFIPMDVNQVPEPSALLLTLVTLGVIGGWRKWKRAT